MKENRETSLASLFHLEAGYAERPAEGGGAVNRGITFTVFKAWRGLKGQPDVTWADLKAMTKEEAVQVYEANFLAPIHFDELPSGVDHALLDTAVNNGVTGAVKILQEALDFPEEKRDGHFGLVTRWAVLHRAVPQLINRILDERLETDQTLKRWNEVANEKTGKTWGQIWSARIAALRPQALAMAGVAAVTAAAMPLPSTLPVQAPKSDPVAIAAPATVLTPILPSPYINRLGMDLLLEGWTKAGFANYVEDIVSRRMSAWRPRGFVLHSTYQPSLATWDADKPVRHISESQRIANMVPLWKKRGFKAGPHLFCDREEIWTATPMWKRGTHSPSWNATFWGLEMVGNYSDKIHETLPDPLRDNAVHAMACGYRMLGHEPTADTFHFHGQDPRTEHKTCPGDVGSIEWWIDAITKRMSELSPGEHAA